MLIVVVCNECKVKLNEKSMNQDLKKIDTGNLQEIEFLGRGTCRKTKLCYDTKLKRYVVAKFFRVYGEQIKFETLYADFEREANIHAQFRHKNIERVLGTFLRGKRSFTLVLEYAPCGNLDRLLHDEKDVPLPWKLRARLFTELADALDYLHNHDPKRRYIYGDLKPKSVLLGQKLDVKLANFDSASIAKLTGASLSITVDSSTKSLPFYTAPEYLKNIHKDKHSSMDVYSYGMIGYEILTRKRVFAGAAIRSDKLLHLIMTQGLKPSTVEVKKFLMQNCKDSEICLELEEIVKQCWQTMPEERPKISELKQRSNELVQNKIIYDKASDEEIETLIEKRNLRLLHPLFLGPAQNKLVHDKANNEEIETVTEKQKLQPLLPPIFESAPNKPIYDKACNKEIKRSTQKKKLHNPDFELARNKLIYDKASDEERETVVEKRKLSYFRSFFFRRAQNKPIYDKASNEKIEAVIEKRKMHPPIFESAQNKQIFFKVGVIILRKLMQLQKIPYSFRPSQNEQVFGNASDEKVKALIKRRKRPSLVFETAQNKQTFPKASNPDVNTSMPNKKLHSLVFEKQRTQSKKTPTIKLWISFLVIVLAFVTAVILMKFSSSDVSDDSSSFFAVVSFHLLIKFDIHSSSISPLSHYPENANSEKVEQILKLDNTIYVIEGWIEHFSVLKLNRSEPSTTWEEITWEEKHTHRNYIAINNSILAVGARDYNYDFSESNIVTENVDMYDTATGEWTALQSMNEARAFHSLVKFQELICAIGGKHSTTSECYYPSFDTWIFLPKMKTMRQRAAAVELNGELYVIGGALAFEKSADKRAQLQSVEKYSSVTNSWKEVASLNQKRVGHTAGVFNGKIYVIGGGPDFVESYDAQKNVWKKQGNIFFDRYAVYAVF